MRTLLVAMLAAVSLPAHAGRPLNTEDASVLEEGGCQVEAWIDRGRDATLGWLVPACNFGAGIEWQVGAGRERQGGNDALVETYAQAKKVWKAFGVGAWGIGTVVGVSRRPLQESARGWENPYVVIPVSIGLTEDTAVHFAPGWSRDREARRNLTVWGVAIESAVHPKVALVAEAFGENASRPFLRAGFRLNAIEDHLDFDLTVVARPNGTREERYVSIGLAYQTGRIFGSL